MKLQLGVIAILVTATSCTLADAPMDAAESVRVLEREDIPPEHTEVLEEVVVTLTRAVEAQKSHFGKHGQFGTGTELVADRVPRDVWLFERTMTPEAYVLAGSHARTPGSACIVQVGAYDAPRVEDDSSAIRAFGMVVPRDEALVECMGGVADPPFTRLWSTRVRATKQRTQPPN